MSNDNIRGILGLDADAYWLTTTVATKSMLTNFLRWEQSIPKEKRNANVGDFAKRVSYWHEKTLMPVSVSIQCNLYRNPPSYSKPVLQGKLREIEKNRNNIFELNIELLIVASKALVACLRKGLGPRTKKEMTKWFQLMVLIHPLLVCEVKKSTESSFTSVIHKYRALSKTVDAAGEQNKTEYPYFHHKILFIHIAHMVFFTCVETKSTHDEVNKCQMKVSNSMWDKWEKVSGDLFNRTLNFSSNGSLVIQNGVDPTFTYIDLPRNWFLRETLQARGIPDVWNLHLGIMNKLHGKIESMQVGQAISKQDSLETYLLNCRFATTSATLTGKSLLEFKRREKARRHHRKDAYIKKGPSYQYKPDDPTKFERDMFLLGNESYYYLFRTEMGKGFRKMRNATTDIVEVVVPPVQQLLFTHNRFIDELMMRGDYSEDEYNVYDNEEQSV